MESLYSLMLSVWNSLWGMRNLFLQRQSWRVCSESRDWRGNIPAKLLAQEQPSWTLPAWKSLPGGLDGNCGEKCFQRSGLLSPFVFRLLCGQETVSGGFLWVFGSSLCGRAKHKRMNAKLFTNMDLWKCTEEGKIPSTATYTCLNQPKFMWQNQME